MLKATSRARAICCLLLAGGGLLTLPALSSAGETSWRPEELIRIAVYPEEILLLSRRAECQLVVTGVLADGRFVDVTPLTELAVENPEIATVGGSRLRARSDGSTLLLVRLHGHSRTVPVTVQGTGQPDPVRLGTEVLAVLTKQGCNAGSCHGSPEGKNGFALSLLGYAPQADERELIHGGLGRRVTPIEPEESLLLKKPLLRVPHVGGKRLRPDDLAYRLLRDWIRQGARPDPEDAPACVSIEVYPPQARALTLPDASQQMSVRARFADGAVRDVTALATYNVSHKDLLTCSPEGFVRGRARGVAAVTVRYLNHVSSVIFTIVPGMSAGHWPDPPASGEIDRLVHEQLKLLGIPPSADCDDATFLRRVFLDLTGLLPRLEQTRAFLADARPDKRAALIDQLLDSEEFARFWAQKSADLMRVNPITLKDGRAALFSNWLRDSWKSNQPFDQFVRELLTATGDTQVIGPANYFLAVPNNEEVTEATAQLFMGSRVNCAKCHNHPFENWTQDDYYRIAAVFVRTKNEQGKIVVNDKGEARNPRTGQTMAPWGSETSAADDEPALDRRQVFADWLTRTGNPYFSRVEANRVWAHLFGRGIVEPVDDFRSSNPPSHPRLLDFLADEFENSGFDRKRLIRLICNSRTYQRSSAANEHNADDVAFFSHYRPRRLTAEQLHDAIGCATQTLAATDTITDDLADCRRQLDELLTRLPGERDDWERSVRETLATANCWQGAWRYTGSFGAKTFEEALETTYGPEVDFDFTFTRTYNEGKIQWQRRSDWNDGETQLLLEAGAGPYFLARTLHAPRSGKAVISLSGNGSVKVWRNEEVVFDCPERRGLIVDDHRLELDLVAGENRLLLKFANGGGLWGFHYELVSFDGTPPSRLSPPAEGSDIPLHILLLLGKSPERPQGDPDVPVDVAEAVAVPAAARTEAQQQQVARLQELSHRELVDLRDRVARLTDWLDYQTQRPFPAFDPFLTAFGQPKRESACACERINEPTIDQALQTLNGPLLRERSRSGAELFLRIADDRALLEEIYLAALMRSPSDYERDVALSYLRGHADRSAAVQDLLWAVLNTREFQFQH